MVPSEVQVSQLIICQKRHSTCANPGFFIRGGPGPTSRKQSERVVFFFSAYFTVYRGGSNGFITEKTKLFQESRGGPIFSGGGGAIFSRGVGGQFFQGRGG